MLSPRSGLRVSAGDFNFKAIGFVQSPFKDKFGIPRQPGLAAAARGVVKIANDPDLRTALRALEEFSHIWIVFVFHEHGGKKWKPSIRPPRLGGAVKVGVLASRSPHRPNPIGISAVVLERVDLDAVGGPELHVSGLDLLDGTPVLDIKPYIPYADSLPDATAGWAAAPIVRVAVSFTAEADAALASLASATAGDQRSQVSETTAVDGKRSEASLVATAVDGKRSEAGLIAMADFQRDETPAPAAGNELRDEPPALATANELRAMIIDVLELDPRPAYQKRQIPLTTDGAQFGFKIFAHEIKFEIRNGGFLVTSIAKI